MYKFDNEQELLAEYVRRGEQARKEQADLVDLRQQYAVAAILPQQQRKKVYDAVKMYGGIEAAKRKQFSLGAEAVAWETAAAMLRDHLTDKCENCQECGEQATFFDADGSAWCEKHWGSTDE